jgi:maleate isomerase
MPDRLGYRGKFAVLGPSTNTVVQPDFDDLRPHGVTNHYSRIFTPNAHAVNDDSFMEGARTIGRNTMEAVRTVMTCAPHYLVMGMSAVTFFGGIEGANSFRKSIEDETGLGVSIGSQAVAAALAAYGNIRRIAFFSPYFPAANAEVRRYFEESGFTVVRDACLRCASWTAIAEVGDDLLRETIKQLNGDDIDAIVQVGTNLSMIRLAAAAELWLGKPVIAINTATYWHALRSNGIADQIAGFGRLMQEF